MDYEDDFDILKSQADIHTSIIDTLKQAWLNEKFSPHILMFEEKMVSEVGEALAEQEERIDSEVSAEGASYLTHLKQLEVDRVRFLLRSYYRTRLRKIEKYGMYILSQKAVLLPRLSPHESTYCQRYVDLVARHYNEAFLNSIPQAVRSLTAVNASENMIPTPKVKTHVFCKVARSVGTFALDEDSTVDLEQGELYLLPYKPIIPLLATNDIVLI